jgi:hypothetical protein
MKDLLQVSNIFISIATLEDEELVDTVFSAFNNTIEKVSFGIAFTTSKDFYDDKIRKLRKIPNLRHMLLDLENNYGTGKGRNSARSMYQNEEYFLQIDSHTEFEKGWDIKLINLYDDVKTETSLDKFVITAALGSYEIVDDKREILDKETSYMITKSGKFFEGTKNVPVYTAAKVKNFPDFFKTKRKFIPAVSICGCFIFGDKNFAENYSLPEECIFNEEQILHSINLISNGFALVFVNGELPLTHYYLNDLEKNIKFRQTLKEISIHDWASIQSENVTNFVNNNKEKCEHYRKYSMYDLTQGQGIEYYIPRKFVLPQ